MLKRFVQAALILANFLTNTPLHGQSSLPPSAIIVDETDAGFQKFGPPQWWYTATGTSFNFYGGGMIYTFNVMTDTINYARWSLPVTATLPMTYEVFAFIPRYHSSTTNARYEVVAGGVTATVAISQNRYYAEWVSLGMHVFSTGGPNFVQLTDSTGEPINSRRIGFDAIAFVPQVSVTPPVTLPAGAYLPITVTPNIAATTSRYIGTMDPARHYAMGCASGRAGEQGVIILAFGQPWTQDGQYGVIYYQPGFPFAPTGAIAEASKAFLRGYWECAPATARLSVAIGTNNYRGATLQPATSFAHGQAWGQMIGQLHTWLQDAAPPGVRDRIAVFGGNDIEMSWNTAALTKAWVDGYASATARPFINFGTCDGCPTSGNPTQNPNNGWTVDDVWQVNRPPYAIPFPEIYLRSGVNADQWYRMSLYAAQNKGAKLAFGGLLTQWQACRDRGTCGGLTDNTPQQGWRQLQDALNADPRTAMPLPPPSDITWRNEGLTTKHMKDAIGIRADILRIPSGDGEIVEGVALPLSAMEFLPGNAWDGGNAVVFAGLVRDPATGGDDANARGGVSVFEVSPAGEYVFPPRLMRAPAQAGALRIVRAEGSLLTLSDGAVSLQFDAAKRDWIK
ncbi:MAG: hypothetical protein RMN52_07155 [Anaerolineae bacterium]|nr:hypothetical protein [Candidatus Roseilinea sp.]MDW8449765.1 hypothetical protein [Anaerolineae bacterium]